LILEYEENEPQINADERGFVASNPAHLIGSWDLAFFLYLPYLQMSSFIRCSLFHTLVYIHVKSFLSNNREEIMVKSIILIIVIGLAIVFSGCTGKQDVTSVVKSLPEVQQFMNEHPNAKITVTYWSKEEVTGSLQEINLQCDKSITPVAMYKAIVSEGNLKIISWINAENQIIICSITQGSGSSQIPTSTPTQTSTPKQTYVSTKAPTSSIVASNNLDTLDTDLRISHKGGDLLKGGEWKISIVASGQTPVYKVSNNDFSVGGLIIATTTTCDAAIITEKSVTGCTTVSAGMYNVNLVHIPSNAMLIDTWLEVR
jgi:hypothetical protein